MKPGKDCMQKCMRELKHHGSINRTHEQMIAICLKQCGKSKYDYETFINIDNIKRQKYYCKACNKNHYTDTIIGKAHFGKQKDGMIKMNKKN